MSVEIRPATPEDVGGIRRVAERAWHAAHAPIVGEDAVEEFLAAHYDAETFRERIAADAAILAVAADPDWGVVGFVASRPADGSPAAFSLDRIYESPDRWGEGIRRGLLAYAEREIDRRGGERVALGVMAENDRAVAFYESAGHRRADAFYDDRIDVRGYEYRKTL